MKILIVGAGLYGATFATKLLDRGHDVTMIELRDHIAGNCYSFKEADIHVHKYGPHIFHTSDREVWEFVNEFSEFKQFTMRAKSMYRDKLYSFPISLQTMKEL